MRRPPVLAKLTAHFFGFFLRFVRRVFVHAVRGFGEHRSRFLRPLLQCPRLCESRLHRLRLFLRPREKFRAKGAHARKRLRRHGLERCISSRRPQFLRGKRFTCRNIRDLGQRSLFLFFLPLQRECDAPGISEQKPQSREHEQEQQQPRQGHGVCQCAERAFLLRLGHADEDHADRLAVCIEERTIRADGSPAAEIGAAEIRRAAREHDPRDGGVRLLPDEPLAARLVRRGCALFADEERDVRSRNLFQVIDETAIIVEQSASLVDASVLHRPIAGMRRVDQQENASHVGIDLLLPYRRVRRACAVVGAIAEREERCEEKDRKKDDAAPQSRRVILALKESEKEAFFLVVLHISEPP